jgi:hypothetical protein
MMSRNQLHVWGFVLLAVMCMSCSGSDSEQLTWTHLSSATGDIPMPPGPVEPTASLLVDVDNDGDEDILVGGRRAAPGVVLYRRNATGWTQYIVEPDAVRIEAGGAFADIDRDGDMDIVFGGDGGNNEVWWWENPSPDFQPNTAWTRRNIKNGGANKHHDEIFGDFDGDGAEELVFWNQRGRKLFLAEIPENPKNTEPWPLQEIYTWEGDELEGAAKADINNDGKIDFVGGGRWFEHTGGANYTAHIIDDAYRFSRSSAGQFIEGGWAEVILGPGDNDKRLRLYEWTGTTWQGRDLLDEDVIHGHSQYTADFNGDGRIDLLSGEMGKWSRSIAADNPHAKIRVFLSDGAGQFECNIVASGYGTHEARPGDLDGDGDIDILSKPFRHNTPRLDVWLNSPGTGETEQKITWNTDARFRLPVTIQYNEYDRIDRYAETYLNFSNLLDELQVTGDLDVQPLQVQEVNAEGNVLDDAVPFQFDRDTQSDAGVAGMLTFLLSGTQPEFTTRQYYVYFGEAGNAGSQKAISVESVQAHGTENWKIQTPGATYLFDKTGGGFTELRDAQGRNWIRYENEPKLEWRGIPNIQIYAPGNPEYDSRFTGVFHPGYGDVASEIVYHGPLKVSIRSKAKEHGDWQTDWDIFPNYARCAVSGGNKDGFAFLYEGVPGGKDWNPATAYTVRSDGVKKPFTEPWTQDLSPEWVCFGDERYQDHTLFMAYHNDDNIPEKTKLHDYLTVFGFAREQVPGIKSIWGPEYFTLGFAGGHEFADVQKLVNSAVANLAVILGEPEVR